MKIAYLIIILLISIGCNHKEKDGDLIKLFDATCIDGFYQTSHFNGTDAWYEKLHDENNNFLRCER